MGGVFLKLDENRELWIKCVEEYKSSGLSQKSWCEQNSVKATSLRYWIMKLNKGQSVTKLNDSPIEFARISITEEESFPSIVLEIKDIKLSITNNYDEILLLKVINTLRKI